MVRSWLDPPLPSVGLPLRSVLVDLATCVSEVARPGDLVASAQIPRAVKFIHLPERETLERMVVRKT